VTDPRLESLAFEIAGEMFGDPGRTIDSAAARTAHLYIEALTTRLAVLLVRHHSTARTEARDRVRPSLQNQIKRALEEFIEAHLAEDIPLGTLATLAGLGMSQFSATFRVSFGCSPHQYVLRRRVARGISLLRATDLAIAEVALAAGFSSQAHFTTLCRRLSGRTPGEHRANA
jgi:AraC family transcriptional regulator